MLFLIRFIYGYVIFKISGSRPGKFASDLMGENINLWKIKSVEGEIICASSVADFKRIQDISRRKNYSCKVKIIKKHGLPFIIASNKKRVGLAVGAVLFAVIFHVLSLFVWTIDICDFDTMSQTSAKNILRRVGFYEGVYGNFQSLKRMQTEALIDFGNLSWITINADGSFGEVNATEKYEPETNDNAPRNMKAICGGQIIRADAYSGEAKISEGDGVKAGDLLISGVVYTELGGTRFVRADGIVMAKTKYHEKFAVPKTSYRINISDDFITRYSAEIFGKTVPLTMSKTPDNKISFFTENQFDFRGTKATLSLITENIYKYDIETKRNTESSSAEIFTKQLALKEIFGFQNKKIISRTIESHEEKDSFIYDVDYRCEENIAYPVVIHTPNNIEKTLDIE